MSQVPHTATLCVRAVLRNPVCVSWRQVQTIMGVARVNGDLAVSRAFGDAQHKQTGGPAQDKMCWFGGEELKKALVSCRKTILFQC